jgi:hypothetical protein
MGLLSGLSKLGSNIAGGVGDLVNNPLKAVNDGLNDKATLTGLAALAGGFGGLGAAPELGGFVTPGAAAGVGGTAGAGLTEATVGGGLLGGLSGLGSSIAGGLTDLGGGSLVKGALGAGLLGAGLAGGLSGSAAPPGVPDYKGAAIATSAGNRYSTVGPTGSTTWSLRPGADPNNPQPGDYIQTTNLSQGQQQLYDQGVGNQLAAGGAAGTQISGLGDTKAMADALYRRGTQYYDTRFGNEEAQLRSRLASQGLQEGSEAYGHALQDFQQNKNTAYADATDRALVGADTAQNSQVNRIAQLLAAARGQTPTAPSGAAGPDLLSAANMGYQAQLGNTNAANAQQSQTIGQLLQAAGLFLG